MLACRKRGIPPSCVAGGVAADASTAVKGGPSSFWEIHVGSSDWEFYESPFRSGYVGYEVRPSPKASVKYQLWECETLLDF